jgi:hypothetical protein
MNLNIEFRIFNSFTLSSSESSVDIFSVPQEKVTLLNNTHQQSENQASLAHWYRFPVV